MKFSWISESPEQTEAIGEILAKHVVPPITLALQGTLGAGKTALVRGLVRQFDSKCLVRSPTYALAHTYPTDPRVHHVDLYRVQNLDLLDLGIENLLDDAEAIVCIEWPDHLQNPLPEKCIQIEFKEGSQFHRELVFSFSKSFSSDWVLTLQHNLLETTSNAG
ncbi:MAG: tRNA (adenosine(37)-N6)-threonylcarbamoyltransferase complex ATPase subunit type 1 TsaE [Myxococcaceae bacterium]|nr:tRNA (adenosine(37)-N6)-threonylcarbamoyltransferase complex ATPase subunit type 1 TsaE [Myxococcaceae bacterium]MBH2006158.1 tRNA (adenosine(37)-N6)-threonylcarbamoyltransferase complex ATPase subunit type 1 TsaE [Myxococcaceae bacterium]